MLIVVQFVLDFVPWSTGAGAQRTSSLHHEVGNDTMEGKSVVKAFFRKLDEVFNGVWRIGVKQIEIDGTFSVSMMARVMMSP